MAENEHYLDQSATTKPSESALRAMNDAAWGNPSSVHRIGAEAAAQLKAARAAVGATLGMPRITRDRLIFTSCGTESNNIALLGTAAAKKRDPERPGTVILSDGEHPSLENPARQLEERQGYRVFRVPTPRGVPDLDALKEALERAKEDGFPVIFAGFMLVNNETGAVYDVKSAASLVRRAFPDAVIHCDAVQGYLKLKKNRFSPLALGVDTMTLSAHKIHAVRGAGALYLSENVIRRKNIVPVMPGGGQEGGFRSGTENLPAIASFAAAAEEGFSDLDSRIERTASLRAVLDRGIARLSETYPGLGLNTPAGESLPNIASVRLPGIRSETMLNFLSGKGIYVSAGSACSAASKKKSAALLAFGLRDDEADSVIRVSMDHTNTEADIAAFLSGLEEGLNGLQRKK